MSIWLLADLVVVLVIGGLAFYSMKRGLLKSSFKGVSSFVALLIVFSFHTPFQGYIENSFVGDTIRDKVERSVETSMAANPELTNDEENVDKLIDEMNLPAFFSTWFKDIAKKQTGNIENIKKDLCQSITELIFPVVMQIISVILLYVLVRLSLWIILSLLRLVVEIPVFGAVDKSLGFLVGAVNGLLILYIVSALLMLFTPTEHMRALENGIEFTYIYKYFYQNNILTGLFFI